LLGEGLPVLPPQLCEFLDSVRIMFCQFLNRVRAYLLYHPFKVRRAYVLHRHLISEFIYRLLVEHIVSPGSDAKSHF
jgi:hypothetical protein